jgi:hypothetical protein
MHHYRHSLLNHDADVLPVVRALGIVTPAYLEEPTNAPAFVYLETNREELARDRYLRYFSDNDPSVLPDRRNQMFFLEDMLTLLGTGDPSLQPHRELLQNLRQAFDDPSTATDWWDQNVAPGGVEEPLTLESVYRDCRQRTANTVYVDRVSAWSIAVIAG